MTASIRNPRTAFSILLPVLFVDKFPDFVRWGAIHKKSMSIQCLIDTVATGGGMVISETIEQMAMSVRFFTAAVARKTGKHVRNFCGGCVSLTGPALEEFGRKWRRQSRSSWSLGGPSRRGGRRLRVC